MALSLCWKPLASVDLCPSWTRQGDLLYKPLNSGVKSARPWFQRLPSGGHRRQVSQRCAPKCRLSSGRQRSPWWDLSLKRKGPDLRLAGQLDRSRLPTPQGVWLRRFRWFFRVCAVVVAAVALALAMPRIAQASQSSGRISGRAFSSSESSSSSSSSGSHHSYSGSHHTDVGHSFMQDPVFNHGPYARSYRPRSSTVLIAPSRADVVVVPMTKGDKIVMMVGAAIVGTALIASTLGAGRERAIVGYPTSVIRLHVALLGQARFVQTDLEVLAERADTSTKEGLHHVLTETIVSLLRRPDYRAYAAAEVRSASGKDAETLFNKFSLEERAKCEQETLVNESNRLIRRQVAKPTPDQQLVNEFIVVSLILALRGGLKLLPIRTNSDLQDALVKLGTTTAEDVEALEVIWAPQAKDDTMTPEELLGLHPNLTLL